MRCVRWDDKATLLEVRVGRAEKMNNQFRAVGNPKVIEGVNKMQSR